MGSGDAAAVNPWLAGEGDEGDLSRVAGRHTVNLFGELLRRLRRYNSGRSHPVQIVGIDLPNSLTLRPDLDPVAGYLRMVDEGVADMVAGLLRTAGAITGGSAAASASGKPGEGPGGRRTRHRRHPDRSALPRPGGDGPGQHPIAERHHGHTRLPDVRRGPVHPHRDHRPHHHFHVLDPA
ncbi:hypothetical protein [Nonomuraea diastatica]